MQINKHGSFYIRNGWPTKIIDAVMTDPIIFSPNNELMAVDEIGVGRVMIKAMRYWAVVTGITYEEKLQQGVTHHLTTLGEYILHNDLYCQDKGTLWLMHRNLARAKEGATAWWWLFNELESSEFTKESFTQAFCAFLQRQGGKYSRNTVDKEFDCLKNTYVSDKTFDAKKILDEDTVPFFAPLNLIQFIGNGKYVKRKTKVKDIPSSILFYCILSDNNQILNESAQIDLDHLLQDENQVGNYMNLSYSVLLELLQQLENQGRLQLVNNFGNRYIHILDNNSENSLREYFQSIVR